MKRIFLFTITNLGVGLPEGGGVGLLRVSSGLLRNMPREQVEAVLGHEIAYSILL